MSCVSWSPLQEAASWTYSPNDKAAPDRMASDRKDERGDTKWMDSEQITAEDDQVTAKGIGNE
jgi:hypothetical protein